METGLILGMMTHLSTDMEIEDAQRDCGTRPRKCRWKATETSVEAEPSPTDSGLSPLTQWGRRSVLSLVFLQRKADGNPENKREGVFPISLPNDPSL